MSEALDRLSRLVDRLRTECPWDREQTLGTLQTFLLEETYEVLEALDSSETARLSAELGDLLFQIFFIARLAREKNWFSLDEVAAEIEKKMIARHPHVFAGERAGDAAAVKAAWEKRERTSGDSSGDPLAGIPAALPALAAALRMSRRAADLGFDWERERDLLAKIEEEIEEARQAAREGSTGATEEELGDLLFALVNWARRRDVDPEKALRGANAKFHRRFAAVAELARRDGRDVSACTPAELDHYWNEVKGARQESFAAGPRRKQE
jgi:MazG family protein